MTKEEKKPLTYEEKLSAGSRKTLESMEKWNTDAPYINNVIIQNWKDISKRLLDGDKDEQYLKQSKDRMYQLVAMLQTRLSDMKDAIDDLHVKPEEEETAKDKDDSQLSTE
jgi:hypothetical protein